MIRMMWNREEKSAGLAKTLCLPCAQPGRDLWTMAVIWWTRLPDGCGARECDAALLGSAGQHLCGEMSWAGRWLVCQNCCWLLFSVAQLFPCDTALFPHLLTLWFYDSCTSGAKGLEGEDFASITIVWLRRWVFFCWTGKGWGGMISLHGEVVMAHKLEVQELLLRTVGGHVSLLPQCRNNP